MKGETKMIRSLTAATGALTATFIATDPAAAQVSRNCADRESIVTRLAERFGETRQSIGLGSNNQVMEVYASLETGTWTITVTHPNGMTCLVAAGQAFETLAEDKVIPEEEA